MKVLRKDYKNGLVKLKILSLDDLWYLHKIISKDDLLSKVTYRKISVNDKEGERKRVFLKIRVEKVSFHDFTNILKVLGVIVESRDDRVPLGDYHSFNISVNDEVIVEKKKWSNADKYYLNRSASRKRSNLLIVACDYGDASFAFYHEYGLEYKGSLSEELGGKKELKQYEKNRKKFQKKLLSTVNQIAETHKASKVLIGGASMITDSLKKIINDYSYLTGKTVLTKINYSGESGIKELIKKGEVDKLVNDSIFSSQVKLVNKLLELIGKEGKAVYGPKQVKEAVDSGAVKHLILTSDYVKRAKKEESFEELDSLINKAELSKASINIIPSKTEHGERVDNLTGITAILRFKIS